MPKVEEAPYIKFRGFIRKAEAIYAGVKEQLEDKHWGEIIVIEPDSGDYFVDKNRRKAMQNAEETYPDKLFHMRRIGDNPAVTRFPARGRPAGLKRGVISSSGALCPLCSEDNLMRTGNLHSA